MLVEILLTLFTFLLCVIAYYRKNIELFYQKLKKGIELVNSIDQNKLNNDNNEAKIIHNSIQIPYKFQGQDYKVFLPFNPTINIDHLNINCYFEKNGEMENITHQPGIPYFITSKHLNADKILLINHENDNKLEFTSDTLPVHSEELFLD